MTTRRDATPRRSRPTPRHDADGEQQRVGSELARSQADGAEAQRKAAQQRQAAQQSAKALQRPQGSRRPSAQQRTSEGRQRPTGEQRPRQSRPQQTQSPERRRSAQATRGNEGGQARRRRPQQQSQGRAQQQAPAQGKRRRPPAQGNQAGQQQRQQQKRRRASKRPFIDTKVVAIVAVSLVVVLGIAGFFLYRQGLLDWTGIGMRELPITIDADDFDAETTPLVVHVVGTRSSGVAFDQDMLVASGDTSVRLPQGSFKISPEASPIRADGNLYAIDTSEVGVEVAGHDVSVEGTSTGALSVTLDHLDIIDATDEQVNGAIAVAHAVGEAAKDYTSLVDANVAALEQLRASSVLPDDMPETLVLESTTSGWSTTVTLLADGSFSGSYTQPMPSQTASDYPNGSAYTCTFSGNFTDVTRIGTTGFSMTVGEIVTENEVGEKWVENGVLNIGAEPIGFETGTTFELYRPGTATDELGYWLSAWCTDYANTGVPDTLDRWALNNVDASYGFFSPAERAASTTTPSSDASGATSTTTTGTATTTTSATTTGTTTTSTN